MKKKDQKGKKEILNFMQKDVKEDKSLIKGLKTGKKSPAEVEKSEKAEHGLKMPKIKPTKKKGGKKK